MEFAAATPQISAHVFKNLGRGGGGQDCVWGECSKEIQV